MKLVITLLVAGSLAIAGELAGRVVGVVDGDTISVLLNGTPTTVRLNGIDCPESRQPFGNQAKEMTATLSLGKDVTIIDRGADRYGRMVGDVLLPDGKSLNRELVKAGMAWWYRKYAPSDWLLKELEVDAQQAKRGFWADPTAMPPWEWRKPAARKEAL